MQRVWAAHGLKPHLTRTFKLSNDPKFCEKVQDIAGLYLDPPDKALVLSVDEKSQIQALDRTQPGLPPKKDCAGTMTHDYNRHGTTSVFAALDVATGKVIRARRPTVPLCESVRGPRRTASTTRASWTAAVSLAMKSVGKPDALIGHVRFDERGRETGRRPTGQATAPFLDFTRRVSGRPGLVTSDGATARSGPPSATGSIAEFECRQLKAIRRNSTLISPLARAAATVTASPIRFSARIELDRGPIGTHSTPGTAEILGNSMSIVNSSAADVFIERLPRCFQFYLVHGSDEGLAHERSKAIIRKILGGNPDPLRFVRLEGDEIARDPSLLAEEAYVGSIFGGSRAILILLGNRDICSALSPLFASPPRDCAIVVRAHPG